MKDLRTLMVLVLGAAVLAWAPHVLATGLMAEIVISDFANEEEFGYPDMLVGLESLEVEVELTESEAIIEEKRAYVLPWDFYAVGAKLTFFRPLGSGEGHDLIDFRIDGMPAQGTILNIEEADELRRSLVKSLRTAGPLGEMGTRLFVSQKLNKQFGGFGDQTLVEFTVLAPTDARSTMVGVDIPVDWHKKPVNHTSVKVKATGEEPVRALYAPYHDLNLDRASANELHGTYTGWDRCTGFPITLLMSTGNEPIHVDLLPFRYNAEEGGRFLALISPALASEEAPSAARDFVLVVDRSGSMQGEKMVQAKTALEEVLEGLNGQDSFNIVVFDDGITTFAQDNQPATVSVKKDAATFIETIFADGSTNIYDSVSTGLASFPTQTGNPRYLVLLTDGEATAGETNTDAILAMAKSHNEVSARIFTFGIGYNVNTVLLDKLASDSAGDAIYIPPGAPVDAAVSAFFAQIVDPALTDPVLDAEAFGVDFLQPAVLGDLFAGQTATLLGRYAKAGEAQIVLSGRVGDDDVIHVFDVELPSLATTESYVPRIWATRQVGELLQELKLGEAGDEVVDEVLSLANRYGVVTEFTYFEVDEEGDAKMVYSPVPVASSGAVAVNTSSSIDGYQKGGTVSEPVDTYVRYAWDRTLPTQEGWFTDTSLPGSNTWIDLSFGSDAHLALAEMEAKLGIGSFLALGTDIKFEHMGRSFRITDGQTVDGPTIETETETIPPANSLPSQGDASVTWVGDTPDEKEDEKEEGVTVETLGEDDPIAVNQGAEEPQKLEAPTDDGVDLGCAAGQTSGTIPGWMLLAALACLALVTRRQAL